MKRATYFIAGLFLALTIGALAADSVTPSRPRFLSVGVGTAAPTSNGNMNVAGSVTASNFVGNVGGVAPTDFARLSQANTFTNALPITLSSTTPFLQFTETDASPSNQHWALFANNEQFRASACTNSGSGCFHWVTVDRTAGTIDSINLNASQVGITGNVVDMNATQVAVNGNPVATTASGSFTATLTGMASSVNGTLGWRRTGNVVTITRSGAALTGTSNAPNMSITGLPAQIVPTTSQNVACSGVRESAIGIGDVMARCIVWAAGYIEINPLKAHASGYVIADSFTSSGQKGLSDVFTVQYTLD